MRNNLRRTWGISIATVLWLLAGCAGLGVKPHERETLALREMQIDPDPIDRAYEDHIYFSIEGSSGGRSFGGGGCGCN